MGNQKGVLERAFFRSPTNQRFTTLVQKQKSMMALDGVHGTLSIKKIDGATVRHLVQTLVIMDANVEQVEVEVTKLMMKGIAKTGVALGITVDIQEIIYWNR